ncbi:MAG: hypothetical protein HZR80_14765 [Candidatus Heimdallarchaeota archaeon]
MLLHWSTDPLLLDKKPTKYNDWKTANSLIQTEGLEAVLKKDLYFKNLYGIMVRKIDFVRTKSSDRIIARFPFLVINKEMQELIQKNILLISEVVRDYFYKSINKSIMQWKEIILNYLAKGSLPFPIFRCSFELEPILLSFCIKNLLHFTSARGEAFTFPTRITNKLAYLCGICNGDGNLRDYWIIVADETKEHIQFISTLLTDLFSKKGKIMKTGGAWIVKLNLLWMVRLFNFLTNQAIDEPKYESLREPLLFQQLGEPFRSLYWRGAFDADGSFKNQITFCSISEPYSDDFYSYLLQNNINANLFPKTRGGFQVNVLAESKFKIADLLGSSHIKKQKDLINFLARSSSRYQFKKFNSNCLTFENYFNFDLIPQTSVLGLAGYFKSLCSKPQNITQKEFARYKEGKGITIRKLSAYLENLNLNLMPFLNEYRSSITFASFSSSVIKLPLKPTVELEQLLSYLIPTAKGAKLYQPSSALLLLRQKLFGIHSKAAITNNHLLRSFLTCYGIYEKIGKKLLGKESFLEQWFKELHENRND